MTTTHISMAQAKATFSAMVEGVAHRGERYLVLRHGRPVAGIVAVMDFEIIEREARGGSTAGPLALVGLWHEAPDEAIDALLSAISTGRSPDAARHAEPER